MPKIECRMPNAASLVRDLSFVIRHCRDRRFADIPRMDRFNPIAIALSLACLAGIDLYLTVFVTGLAIHLHWVTLAPSYQSLELLGHPWIIAIAGVMYALEFFADKVPWLDSAWDTVHTIIRPIGGALLAPTFAKQNLLGETIAWAVPCLSGRGRRIPANLFGALIATNEEPHKIVFVGRKNWKAFCQTIDLEGSTIARDPQFLSENLVIVPSEGRGPKYSFLFTRSRGPLVELIAEDLRHKLSTPSSHI